MTFPYEGKRAIVTGAGSGIGRALVVELRARGASVVSTDVEGDVDRVLDVRDLDAFRALVEEVGVPDLLFGNAGISMGGPTHELSAAHWDRTIDVNLRGVVHGVLAVYPGMVERGSGHIVNTASAAGLAAPPFVAPYAATKHAVVGLSLGLRPEAALHGVRVTVLCPGTVETGILDRLPDADLPARASKPVTARQYLTLLKQKPAPAETVARRTLDRVGRNKAIITVPMSARSLWLLHRVSPALMTHISRMIAERVDRELVRPTG